MGGDGISNKTNIVGSITEKKLKKWIESYFDPKKKAKKFAVLYGKTGTGKTYIPTQLADHFDLDLFHITPDDLTSKSDVNNIYKSLNSSFSERLILIDDVGETKYVKDILKFHEISKYPVIYTSSKWVFNSSVFSKGVYVRLDNFSRGELYSFLQEKNSSLSKSEIKEIASKAKSIRRAVLAVEYDCPNDMQVDSRPTFKDLIRQVQLRDLRIPIDRSNINFLFRSIKGYSKNSLSAMDVFSKYEYRIRCKFEKVDPLEVNLNDFPRNVIRNK